MPFDEPDEVELWDEEDENDTEYYFSEEYLIEADETSRFRFEDASIFNEILIKYEYTEALEAFETHSIDSGQLGKMRKVLEGFTRTVYDKYNLNDFTVIEILHDGIVTPNSVETELEKLCPNSPSSFIKNNYGPHVWDNRKNNKCEMLFKICAQRDSIGFNCLIKLNGIEQDFCFHYSPHVIDTCFALFMLFVSSIGVDSTLTIFINELFG